MNQERAKVLIVEDDQIIGMHLSNVVNNFGYQVLGVLGNGEAVLEKITTDVPDVMLVDIGLKGNMNGIELVRKVKSKHDIPVIYLSSTNDDEPINAAEETFPLSLIHI